MEVRRQVPVPKLSSARGIVSQRIVTYKPRRASNSFTDRELALYHSYLEGCSHPGVARSPTGELQLLQPLLRGLPSSPPHDHKLASSPDALPRSLRGRGGG